MVDEEDDDSLAQVMLPVLRALCGWNQADLAQAADCHPNLISDYEQGRKKPSPAQLERLVTAVGLDGEGFDRLALAVFAARASLQGHRPALDRGKRRMEIARAAAHRAGDLTRAVLEVLAGPEGRRASDGESEPSAPEPADRLAVEGTWQRLRRHPLSGQRALVREASDFQSWALCERLVDESVGVAGADPAEARELAELAQIVAERSRQGDLSFRLRLSGLAWAALANAHRAAGELQKAEGILQQARGFWQQGAASAEGLLIGSLLLELERK